MYAGYGVQCFINGRLVGDADLEAAVMEAYRGGGGVQVQVRMQKYRPTRMSSSLCNNKSRDSMGIMKKMLLSHTIGIVQRVFGCFQRRSAN